MNSLTRARLLVKGSIIFTSVPDSFQGEDLPITLPDCLKSDRTRIQELVRLRVDRANKEEKFIFAVFNSPNGPKRLESIVAKILPRALGRTWAAVMTFGGSMPYPGTEKIADQIGRSERTAQENLKALRDLGLMRELNEDAPPKEDGSPAGYKVDYKDFSALYHFAYEYYEWTRTPLYQQYRPVPDDCKRLKERHNIYEAMQQNSLLMEQIRINDAFYQDILLAEYIYRKVLRFENYEQCLGRVGDIAQADIEELGQGIAENQAREAQTRELAAASAPYISNNNNNIVTMDDSNHLSTSNVDCCSSNSNSKQSFDDHCFDVSNNDLQLSFVDNYCDYSDDIVQISSHELSRKRTNEEQVSHKSEYALQTHQSDISQKSSVGIKEATRTCVVERIVVDTCITDNNRIASLQHVTPTKENLLGQNVKQAITNKKVDGVVYSKNGKAYKSKEELKAAGERYQESQARLQRCEHIADVVRYICRDLNDKSPQSTPTTVCKIYEESGLSEEEFLKIIHYAREHVRKLYDEQVTAKDEKGQTKRVPLFIKEIRRAVAEGVNVLQARDQAYTDARFAAYDQENSAYMILSTEMEDGVQRINEQDAALEEDAGSAPAQDEATGDIMSVEHEEFLPDQPVLQADSQGLVPDPDAGGPGAPRSYNSGITMAEIWQAADEIWHRAMRQALLTLHQETGLLVVHQDQACSCGGHLQTITEKSQRRCLSCDAPLGWGRDVLDGLQAILAAQVPEPEECIAQVMNQLGLLPEDVVGYELYFSTFYENKLEEQACDDNSSNYSSQEEEPQEMIDDQDMQKSSDLHFSLDVLGELGDLNGDQIITWREVRERGCGKLPTMSLHA